MKINRMIMKVGAGLMLLTLILCIVFQHYIKLKKPVFLRYCMEVEATSNQVDDYNSVIQLQYITNSDEGRSVVGIFFTETPEVNFSVTETPFGGSFFNTINVNTKQQLGNIIGKYSLRTVYLRMNNYFREEWRGEKELHTAQVSFNDGSTLVTDIGSIILYSDSDDDQTIIQEYGSSSSDLTSASQFKVKNPITLVEIKSRLFEDISKLLYIRIDGKNYDKVPWVERKSGTNFYVYSDFGNAQGYDKYDFYDIKPKLVYKNADNTTGFIRIYNIRRERYFSDFKDILSYLKKRGAI